MKERQIQTMSAAFSEICQGIRPWTALGNFMNEWYDYSKDQRPSLIADPLPAYEHENAEHHQWAVFCAASVEWFCATYQVPCPAWVYEPQYLLAKPWFFPSRVQARLLETTPDVFRRRNIFCGDKCYTNKWELVEQLHQHTISSSGSRLQL